MTWVAFAVGGCAVNPPPSEVPAASERELTLGLVQREVHTGVTGERVITALGSPNLVTRDADGSEVWVYDRVASERIETTESGSVVALAAGSAGSATGAAAGQASRSRTNQRTSQKTLTVVIRFDGDSRVSTVSVHSTRF